MTPRRILIFSLVYYPKFVGGAEVAVKEVTDRISSLDIEFDMITMRTADKAFERIGNINVHRVGFYWGGKNALIGYVLKYLYMPMALLKALSLHRRSNYFATWSIMANYAGGPALFFKWFHPTTPLILTLQEGDSFDHIRHRAHLAYPFLKVLFKKADRIQAISSYLADWGRDMGAKCPIEVVPNGVDVYNFSRAVDPQKKKILRSSCGFSDLDVVLVTASRLVSKNATEDIVGSLAHLDPRVKLLILGSGPDESMLRELVAKDKLDSRVVFKGFIDHKELPEYLQASNIFVRPSRTEGLGNSFLEAMAAGIPVIATPVGGIPDFLTDGETGLFCEVDNPQSIAQKVEKLIKDRESREYIVRNAAKMVADKYGWDDVSKKMWEVLKTVKGGGRRW